MIQFDEHIFQMGWNHQLVMYFLYRVEWMTIGGFFQILYLSKKHQPHPLGFHDPIWLGGYVKTHSSDHSSMLETLQAGDWLVES